MVIGRVPFEYVPPGSQRQTVTILVGNGIYFCAVVAEDALGNFDPVVRSVSGQASLPSPFPEIAVGYPADTNLRDGGDLDLGVVVADSSSWARVFTIQNAGGSSEGSEIAVRQWTGTELNDGTAGLNLGTVAVGASGGGRTFTIWNTGNANLDILAPIKLGGEAGEFVVSATGMALTLAAGGSTTFNVILSPGATGTRETTLQISSNDANEGVFDIGLMGVGNAARELFDDWPVAASLTGSAATPGAQPYADGVANLLKYAFNMNGAGADVRVLVPGTGTGGLPAIGPRGSGATSVFRFKFIRRIGN